MQNLLTRGLDRTTQYGQSLLLASLLAIAAAPETAIGADNTREYLPLTKADIVRIAVASFHAPALKAELFNAVADQRTGLKDKDEVSVIRDNSLPLVVFLAGVGEHVHTVRVYFPVVNNSKSKNDAGMAFLSAIFVRLYPNWPNAGTWPANSLRTAWDASPLVTHVKPTNSNNYLIHEERDGITNTTFGVPPDLVVYVSTVRAVCIPDAHKENPFQRVIC